MMTRPLKVEGAQGATQARAPGCRRRARRIRRLYDGDFDVGLAAFCRGAGIDPRTISAEARDAALQLAGQLLREAVLGLMDLNQSRNEFRNRFRMSAPAARRAGVALEFFARRRRSAGAPAHHHVDPRGVGRGDAREFPRAQGAEHRHARGDARGVRGVPRPRRSEGAGGALRSRHQARRVRTQNKAKYWDLYSEMFAGLAQRPADGFPHLFTETFAKAYEAKLRGPGAAAAQRFGADRGGTGPAAIRAATRSAISDSSGA